MNALSEREQKLIAGALLMAVLAALWLGAVSPWIQGFELRRGRRETALHELGQNARLLANGRVLRNNLASQERLAASVAFVAPSTAIGTDLARRRVISAAQAEALQLSSLRSTTGTALNLRLEAEVHGDLTQLTHFIQDLENGKPCASVDAIVINAATPEQSASSVLLEAHLAITYGFVAGDHQG